MIRLKITKERSVFKGIISLVIFFIAAIYITYPLIFHLGDRVTGYGDELVIAWIQNWVIHGLSTNPLTLFQANLYFPYHNTLAYSETFITSSILAIPVRFIVGQPIATVNFTLITSLVLLGFSLYLLSYYITKDYLASLLSGIIVIFSPAVLSNYMHLQIIDIGWVVFSMLFFLIFLKTHKSLYLGVSFFFFLFQIYNAILPGFFLLFFYFISIICSLFINKNQTLQLINKKNILFTLVLALILIPLAIPYFSVSKEFNYTRDIRDAIHFALQPEDLLYPGNTSRLEPFLNQYIPTNHYSQNSEFKPGYLGVVFSLLSLVSIFYFVKNFKKKNLYLQIFIFVALTGLVVSFGPFLHLFRHTIHKPFPIPLPYALFYYIIPGFNGIRNSQMWELLFIISIAVAIALVMSKLLQGVTTIKRYFLYVFIYLMIIAEFSGPIPLVTIPQVNKFPKIYSWLNTIPQNSSYIEMPIYNWNMPPYTEQELWREYYSTSSFRDSVNGYTGFSPPPWQDFIYFMNKSFPNKESIKKIRLLGVQYIIIDEATFDEQHKANIHVPPSSIVISKLNSYKNLTFIRNADGFAVYAIGEKK